MGTKIGSNGPGRMTKMATMPIYDKTLKTLLLWNKKVCDLETWYVALGARVLPNLFNGVPMLTLAYFTARSNLVPYAFLRGKGKTITGYNLVRLFFASFGDCPSYLASFGDNLLNVASCLELRFPTAETWQDVV